MAAPLVLFVYNRPDHLTYTLAALQNNRLIRQTPLFIYSDGPKSETDEEAVKAVRALCKGVKGFASVEIIESPKNKGLANSVISGVSEQMNAYGQAVVLEDDLVTSPNFLLYMNTALQQYKDDPKVSSVTGYSYPSHVFTVPGDYTWDTYVSYRSCSWGWATWKDRWEKVDWDMSYYPKIAANNVMQRSFNAGGKDHFPVLKAQYEGKVDSWAIRFSYARFTAHQYCVYPAHSLVMNIGLDGSGVHCGVSRKDQHERLDMSWLPKKLCPGKAMHPKISRDFYNIFL